MKAIKWVHIIKGIIFILIAVVFIGLKFYSISLENLYTEHSNSFFDITDYSEYTFLIPYWQQIFKEVFSGVILFFLFLTLGILEIIQGVDKNGN